MEIDSYLQSVAPNRLHVASVARSQRSGRPADRHLCRREKRAIEFRTIQSCSKSTDPSRQKDFRYSSRCDRPLTSHRYRSRIRAQFWAQRGTKLGTVIFAVRKTISHRKMIAARACKGGCSWEGHYPAKGEGGILSSMSKLEALEKRVSSLLG